MWPQLTSHNSQLTTRSHARVPPWEKRLEWQGHHAIYLSDKSGPGGPISNTPPTNSINISLSSILMLLNHALFFFFNIFLGLLAFISLPKLMGSNQKIEPRHPYPFPVLHELLKSFSFWFIYLFIVWELN